MRRERILKATVLVSVLVGSALAACTGANSNGNTPGSTNAGGAPTAGGNGASAAGNSSGSSGGSAGANGGSATNGGGSSGGSGSTAGSGGGGSKAAIHANVALATNASGAQFKSVRTGASNAATLESLKYLITGISICETMEANGTGFSNQSNCLSIYDNQKASIPYDPSDGGVGGSIADVARTKTEGWIDLMDPASRAQLASTTVITASQAHAYSWGIINWAPPMKIRASIPLGGGSDGASPLTLFTHDGPMAYDQMSDGYKDWYTVPSRSLLAGPSEDAVILWQNGGNLFKFQSPLVITQDDIDQGRQWVLDMVFNPEGLAKAYSLSGAGSQNAWISAPLLVREKTDAGDRSARGFTIPPLTLTPVPHRAGESVVREQYIAHMNGSDNPYDVRVELYSVQGDANRTVFGVDMQSLLNASSINGPPMTSNVTYVERDDRGALVFESWAHTPIVTGFSRGAMMGDGFTAQIRCTGSGADPANGTAGGTALVGVSNCPAGKWLDANFTLVSQSVLADSVSIGSGSGPLDAGAPTGDGRDGGDGGGNSGSDAAH